MQNNITTEQSFTDFFIHRPVFSWVVNIVIILLGLTAFFQLTTRQYPVTEGSVITVRTNMDASGRAMESQVTNPLEDAFSALSGLESMDSDTQKNESKIRLQFTAGRSLDAAAADVRELLARTQSKLPDEAEPIVTKGNVDAPSVMELAITNSQVSLADIYYLIENNVKGAIESIPGVGTVDLSGGSDYQMSVVLDPQKMFTHKITASDITRSLKNHNFQLSAGRLKEAEREFSLTTQACLRTPQEFGNVVLNQYDKGLVRLMDVANISICPAEEEIRVLYNGKPAISLTIRPQANANPIEISTKVRAKISKIQETLPRGTEIHVAIDKALFIQDSIKQVYHALFEAVILVLFVVLFFLRSLRASLVPLITIPISLIGAFFIMYALGFTINILSLLALVLAIGLVVDDAIVVLENVYRYIEEGEKPLQAAILGTREIRFSIIAMTITLAAVYAPIAIAPGLVGKVFKEFALTLAGAVLISGITALTLSPAMCARLLQSHDAHTTGSRWKHLSDKIEHFLNVCEDWYARQIPKCIYHRQKILMGAVIFSALCGLWAWFGIKKELAPAPDEGLLYVNFVAGSSRNLHYISSRAPQLEGILNHEKDIMNQLMTLQTMEESRVQTQLKPWSQRKRSCRDISDALRERLRNVQGLDASSYCPKSAIIGGGGDVSYPLQFKILSNVSDRMLKKFGREIRRELKQFPGIARVEASEIAAQKEIDIILNRDRISQLHIDLDEVAQSLRTLIRGVNVGKFEKDGKQYPVRVHINEQSTSSLQDIASLLVRARDESAREEKMVVLKDIVSFEEKESDPVVEHSDKKRSYNVRASLKPGYGLGNVFLGFVDKLKKEGKLSNEFELEPAGELKRYFAEQGAIYLVFALAIAFIFLVLAAQFESVRAPLIIMLSVPLALGGGILALCCIKSGSLNVYSQIGLITLIGLITKHGILLVDFANQKILEGRDHIEAIVSACRRRLRPILMTTLAMVLGALPLMFATGPGAEARQQIGTVIVGGMSLGTIFTLFVIPVFYILVMQPAITDEQVRNYWHP